MVSIICDFSPYISPWFLIKYTVRYHVKHPAGLEMGRVKKILFHVTGKKSIMRFAVFFSCFYVVHEGQFYCDFEFSLGFTVYSWHVGVRKRFLLGSQRAQNLSGSPFFSGDLYIFAKYAPVFSNRAFPTTFAPPIAAAMCERTSKWGHSFFFGFLGKMSTDRERWHDVCAHVQVNVPWRNIMGVRKYNWTLLPHPTPMHPTPPLRDVTHLQRTMTYCAHVQVNVPWRNIMGVRKYVNVIAPPHPTPRNIYKNA